MRRSRKPIVIAARQSPLAKIQAEQVGQHLARRNPQMQIKYHWVTTSGDAWQDGPLSDRGGKGLFTRAVDEAVLNGEADIAVHSLKDLPAKTMAGMALVAVLRREDARDCLISRSGAVSIDQLPQRAVVGTSSPRRAAQLLARRPDLVIEPIRGNVDTRLRKVLDTTDGQRHFDATLLAMAGLNRLGLHIEQAHPLDVDLMLPAAGQAAIAVQCRAADSVAMTRCLPLNDPDTSMAVNAEREVLTLLGADCHSPVAVFAEPTTPDQPPKRNADAHWFRLRIRLLAHDGRTCLAFDEKVRTRQLVRLVKRGVKQLLDQGGRKLLDQPPPTADKAASGQAPSRTGASPAAQRGGLLTV